jgi:hypothetical protein
MKTMEKKSLEKPDETRTFPNGKMDVVKVGDVTFGRMKLMPGWKWSESVKPVAKTDSCLVPHTQYVISGRIVIRMDDGTEKEMGPGDACVIPPGHDAWVVGNEPVVAIDFTGGETYATPHKH